MSFFKAHFIEESGLNKLFGDIAHKSCREMVERGEISHFQRRILFFKPLHHYSHDDHRNFALIVGRDGVDVIVEAELKNILRRVAQDHARKRDGPRKLHPQQEQRQECEATVNGIVLGDIELSRDKEILKNLESGSGKNSADECILELHFRVGEKHVHTREG